MSQYYFHNGQKESGPLTLEQLKKENLKKDTPVWYTGLIAWVTAGEIDELEHLFTQNPPPFNNNLIQAKPPKLEIKEEKKDSTTDIKPTPKKKSFSFLIIGGILTVLLIVGLFTYQNQVQADALNNVKLKIEQEKEELIQKENQNKAEIEEKEKQQEIQLQKEKAAKEKANVALNEKYMGFRNNWQNYISAYPGNYASDAWGGITNLSIEVYNSTDKLIDEVQVKIGYIKDNGGIFKFETVSITNIGPGSNKTVIAPSSNRGVKVNTEIINITAKSFHFCYPGGMYGGRNADPFFCK